MPDIRQGPLPRENKTSRVHKKSALKEQHNFSRTPCMIFPSCEEEVDKILDRVRGIFSSY